MSLDRLFVEVGVYVLTAEDRIFKKKEPTKKDTRVKWK